MKILNVVFADDHSAIMAGLRMHVDNLPGTRIIEEAQNSTVLVDLLDAQPCDVIVVDYAMPSGRLRDDLARLELLRRHYPDIAVVVYTAIEAPALLEAIHQRGPRAVASKSEPPVKIAAAIRNVAEGPLTVDPSPQALVPRAKRSRKHIATGIPRLTRLEAEVVRLYVSGLTINEIAQQRNRTKQTISAQKQSAKRKLNITRDFDLIHYMTEKGFATLSEAAAMRYSDDQQDK
ncbi:response regulator transcription factor [Burkholderia sp. 572]|uniref:response regulator transcription factor n=1 Tax=Burkholderia sp. 572 TaxID=3156414 RepID=UPI0033990FC6